MALFTLADLRKSAADAGFTGSDEQILTEYAKRTGRDPYEVANRFGYDGGHSSKTSERFSAATDNYQGGLYGVGEAVAGSLGMRGASDWMRRQREDNQFQANVASQRAKDLGAVDSYKDVDGIRSGADYLAGLAIQSAPYLGEALVGGWAGRGLATGAKLSSQLSREMGMTAAEAAANRTLANAGRAGAVVGSYPSAVGDILQNQREAGDGRMNLGSAMLGGVPYAALNAFGLEGAMGRGGALARMGSMGDGVSGIHGGLARLGKNAAIQGGIEGLTETGQEVINQYFGRMAMDPRLGLADKDAIERYKESFVGGAALGGAMTATPGFGGGWKRSDAWHEQRATDLLQGQQIPDTQDLGLRLRSHQEEAARLAAGGAPAAPPGALGDLAPPWGFADYVPPTEGLDPTGMVRSFDDPLTTTGRAPLGDNLQMPVVPGTPWLPDTLLAGPGAGVAATDAANAAMQDPGTIEAMRRAAAVQAGETAPTDAANEIATLGLPAKLTKRAKEVLADALQSQKAGVLDDEGFATVIGHLQGGKTAAAGKALIAEKNRVAVLASAPAVVAPTSTQANVVVPPPVAPVAQGAQANAGVPDVPGTGAGVGGAVGGGDAGGSVAGAGPVSDPAIGGAAAAGVVPADPGQAAVLAAQQAGQPAAAVAAPMPVVGTGDPSVPVKKKGRSFVAPTAEPTATEPTATEPPAPAAFGTAERVAQIKAKLSAKKASPNDGKRGQGGAVDFEAIGLYVELGANYIGMGVRSFGAFSKQLLTDAAEAGDDIAAHVRQIHTKALAEFNASRKKVDIAVDKAKAQVVSISRNATNEDTKLTAKLKGWQKGDPYATAVRRDGQWVLDTKASGLDGAPEALLGETAEDALAELPYAVAAARQHVADADKAAAHAEAVAEGKKVDKRTKRDTSFKPSRKVVIGGRIDFDAMNEVLADRPDMHEALRLMLGLDEDGNRVEPMRQEAAAVAVGHSAGWTEAARLKSRLGITSDVAKRFMAGDETAPPMADKPDKAPAAETTANTSAQDLLDEALGASEQEQIVDDLVNENTNDPTNTLDVNKDDESADDNVATNNGLQIISSAGQSAAKGAGSVRPNRLATSAAFAAVNKAGGIQAAPTSALLLAYSDALGYIMPISVSDTATPRVKNIAAANGALFDELTAEVAKRERDRASFRGAGDEFTQAQKKRGDMQRTTANKESSDAAEADAPIRNAREAEGADTRITTRPDLGTFDSAEQAVEQDDANGEEGGDGRGDLDGGAEGDVESETLFSKVAGDAGITRRNLLLGAAATAATKANAGPTLGKAAPVSEAVLKQDMPPAIAKLLRGNGSGTTNLDGAQVIKSTMQQIASSGPAELRALAAQIANLLPAGDVLLTVDDKRTMNAHGVVRFGIEGPHMMLFTAGGRTGLSYGTFMHEALHLAVLARYKTLANGMVRSNDALFKMSAPNAAAQMAQLRALWNEFEDAAKANPPKDEETKLSVREAVGSPDEFFVRALTDARLQAYMAGIEYEGKSMLARFKDWVVGLFVKSGTRPSWLDAALLASTELNTAMSGDRGDFSRLRASNELGSAKREALYSTVASALKRWFGASKIVNADGSPKVMYHGTARNIEAFRPKQAGAIFVTDDPKFADDFSRRSDEYIRNNKFNELTEAQLKSAELAQDDPRRDDGFTYDHDKLDAMLPSGMNIMPLYVKAENPFDYTDPAHARALAMKIGAMARDGSRLNQPRGLGGFKLSADNGNDVPGHYDLRDAYGSGVKQLEQDLLRGSWTVIESKQAQAAIKALGHDSFYVKEDGRKNLGVYDPAQLKSATGNNGNYDPADPRVMYSRVVAADSSLRQAIAGQTPKLAKDAWTNISDKLAKFMPWVMTNFQLAETFGDKMPKLREFVLNQQAMTVARNVMVNEVNKTAETWEKLRRSNPAAGRALDEVMQRATMLEMHVDTDDFGTGVNAHLKPEQRAAFDALRAKFKALPDSAKAVYKDAQRVLDNQWKQREAAYNQFVTEMTDARIAEAQKRGDTDAVAELEKSAAEATEQYRKTLGKVKGPYFPLLRFGDYLAVGKSAAYQELEGRLEQAVGGAATKLRAELDAMKKGGKDYIVSAHEDRAAAERASKEYEARGLVAYSSLADIVEGQITGVSRDSLEQFLNSVKKEYGANSDEANKLAATLTDVFIKSMPEMHALRREAERKGVEGASTDMLRAFAAAGQQGAFYTSRMLHAKTATDTLLGMKKEARGTIDMEHVAREMQQRTTLDMTYKTTPVQDAVGALSWAYHLGVSPAFLAINTLQPLLVTLPMLGAKYSGSTGALKTAWADALSILKDARFKNGKFDPWSGISETSLKNQDERIALRELLKRGIIDESQSYELNMYADDSNNKLARAQRWMGMPSQQIEMVNRISTALATYRLEMAKPGRDKDAAKARANAIDAAFKMTTETQMDYSAEGTARVMRDGGGVPLAKLVFQFRRYQQGMLYLIGSNIKKAISNPAERKEALAALGYLSIAAGLSAGAMGLPFIGIVFWAINKGLDDDDPEGDAETRLRNYLRDYLRDLTGSREAATALAKGIPAMFGADISARIGLGDVATPFPMARFDKKTGKEQVGEVLLNVLGPSAGLGAQFYDGMQRFAAGDWVKGSEKMLPKAAADAIRAGRYSSEGMTDTKGELIPIDFNGWDMLLRGIGVAPIKESDYYEASNAIRNAQTAANKRKGDIGNLYQVALRTGDMESVRKKIDKWNDDHPTNRITGKDEVSWRKDAVRTTAMRNTETGIKFDPKRDKDYASTIRYLQ